MIKITATTMSNSTKENPLGLRMNSPQAGAFARGRGSREVRLKRTFFGGLSVLRLRNSISKWCAGVRKSFNVPDATLVRLKGNGRQKEPGGGGECGREVGRG